MRIVTSSALATAVLVKCSLVGVAAGSCCCQEDQNEQEWTTLSLKEYEVEVQVPASWKLVSKADEAMVFGFSIPNETKELEAGIKCEIGPAPETLDEYRTRIDRRAERQRASGV